MNMEEIYSDDALVEQIRLGDEKAAEELIRRYYTSVLRYCKRQCFNLEKAEDLTQETFLKLFKNLSGYREKGKSKLYSCIYAAVCIGYLAGYVQMSILWNE